MDNFDDDELMTHVRFARIEIREYESVIGDHPCVGSGPPVSLGNSFIIMPEVNIRPLPPRDRSNECNKNKNARDFLLNAVERIDRLKKIGFSDIEIKTASTEAQSSRNHRVESRNPSKEESREEVMALSLLKRHFPKKTLEYDANRAKTNKVANRSKVCPPCNLSEKHLSYWLLSLKRDEISAKIPTKEPSKDPTVSIFSPQSPTDINGLEDADADDQEKEQKNSSSNTDGKIAVEPLEPPPSIIRTPWTAIEFCSGRNTVDNTATSSSNIKTMASRRLSRDKKKRDKRIKQLKNCSPLFSTLRGKKRERKADSSLTCCHKSKRQRTGPSNSEQQEQDDEDTDYITEVSSNTTTTTTTTITTTATVSRPALNKNSITATIPPATNTASNKEDDGNNNNNSMSTNSNTTTSGHVIPLSQHGNPSTTERVHDGSNNNINISTSSNTSTSGQSIWGMPSSFHSGKKMRLLLHNRGTVPLHVTEDNYNKENNLLFSKDVKKREDVFDKEPFGWHQQRARLRRDITNSNNSFVPDAAADDKKNNDAGSTTIDANNSKPVPMEY